MNRTFKEHVPSVSTKTTKISPELKCYVNQCNINAFTRFSIYFSSYLPITVLSSFFSIDLHQGSYCHKFCGKLIVHPKVNSMATSVPTWCIVCETIIIIHTAGILLTLCFRQSINQLNQSSNQSINPSINISVMCYIFLSIRKVWRYKWDRSRKSKKNRQHHCQKKTYKTTNNDPQNIHI